MQKLDADGKRIIDNFKKAIPKLTPQQKEKLITGSEFLVAFTEQNSGSNSTPSTA